MYKDKKEFYYYSIKFRVYVNYDVNITKKFKFCIWNLTKKFKKLSLKTLKKIFYIIFEFD